MTCVQCTELTEGVKGGFPDELGRKCEKKITKHIS